MTIAPNQVEPDSGYERQATGDLERVLAILRRRAGLIILCTLVTAGAAVGFSLLQEKQYTATASLLFRDPEFTQTVFGGEGSLSSGSDATRQAATNIELVSLRAISDRTADELDADLTAEQIDERIEVSAEGQSDVATISATDPDPEQAHLLANTFAEEFISFRAEADRSKLLNAKRRADRQFDSLSTEEQEGPRGAQLSRGAERLGILASLQTGNAELVQPAQVPGSASSPQPRRNGILGLIVGLMLGTGLAVLFERLNRTLRDPEETRQAFGHPIVGTVPESKAIVSSNEGEAVDLPFAETEAFRMMRASLRYFNVDKPITTLMVTSSGAQEGKSTVAWNLANVTSSGSKVVLLETDLRNPTLSRQHGINSGPGLSELLTHQVALADAVQRRTISTVGPTPQPEQGHVLDIIVAGSAPPNPAELIESQAMAVVMNELADQYDLVVVDTPPLGVVADAMALINRVDGILVVSRIGGTTYEAAQKLTTHLSQSGAPVLGLVANGVSQPKRGKYGYGYGYGYEARST